MPDTDVSTLSSDIDGIKPGGSFLILFEGHLVATVLLALLFGGAVFALRRRLKRTSR